MRWLVALLACIGIAQAQIVQHQIYDDGYARVPLQFPFPYYGRVFTESYMFSNGVVGFLNPTNSWCCTGFDLRTSNGTPFNFAIMPLQTDLINYGQGRFLTEGTTTYQRYKWENISEYGVPQNLNTFGVEIRPNGYIGMHYEQVNISPWRPVTIGMTGDTSLGEYTQHYHGSGFIDNTVKSYIYNPDPCSGNPLYSPSCAGYQDAYRTQQCSINPLYDRTCPGYAEAYALANIVPSPSNNTVSTQSPQVTVSTTGTISVETPVVADPVVNEVITRQPTQAVTSNANQTNTSTNNVAQAEPKTEKKVETKQVASTKGVEVKNQGMVATPVGVAPTIKTAEMPKGFDIIDYSHRKLIANLPSIRENRRILWMSNDSDKKHREMVDGQWSR